MTFLKPYKELEHTADIRLEIRSLTWPGLLRNAVFALTDTMADISSIKKEGVHTLNLKAPSRDELFMACLKKIHLLFETKGFLTRQIKVVTCKKTTLKAFAFGEAFEPKRHTLKTEIKAITYHQLEVKWTWRGWRAWVIFDI